jgi:hypothetical protein
LLELALPVKATDWLPVDPPVVSEKSIHAAAGPLLKESSIVPSLTVVKLWPEPNTP